MDASDVILMVCTLSSIDDVEVYVSICVVCMFGINMLLFQNSFFRIFFCIPCFISEA